MDLRAIQDHLSGVSDSDLLCCKRCNRTCWIKLFYKLLKHEGGGHSGDLNRSALLLLLLLCVKSWLGLRMHFLLESGTMSNIFTKEKHCKF